MDNKEEIDSRLEALQFSMKRLESRLESHKQDLERLKNERGSFLVAFQEDVQSRLLESPLVTYGRWAVGLFIVAGLFVWFGGSISNSIQIKSVLDQSVAAKEEIGRLTVSAREDLATRQGENEKFFAERKKSISDAAQQVASAAAEVTDAALEARSEIDRTLDAYSAVYGDDQERALESVREELAAIEKRVEETTVKVLQEHEALGKELSSVRAELLKQVASERKQVDLALSSFTTLDSKAMGAFFTSLVGGTWIAVFSMALFALSLSIFIALRQRRGSP